MPDHLKQWSEEQWKDYLQKVKAHRPENPTVITRSQIMIIESFGAPVEVASQFTMYEARMVINRGFKEKEKRRKEKMSTAGPSSDAAEDEFSCLIPLPPLTGTERQVQWAESIRSNMIPVFYKLLAKMPAGSKQAAVIENAIQQSEAPFWIARHDTFSIDDYMNDQARRMKLTKHELEADKRRYAIGGVDDAESHKGPEPTEE